MFRALFSFHVQLLFPLLDKCSVTLDSTVMKHPFFNCDLVRCMPGQLCYDLDCSSTGIKIWSQIHTHACVYFGPSVSLLKIAQSILNKFSEIMWLPIFNSRAEGTISSSLWSSMHPQTRGRLVLISVLILVDYFYSDPEALRLLIKLYIERSHSVWKEPEVSSLELVRGTAVT